MSYVLSARNVLKILDAIILFVAVLVIHLEPDLTRAEKYCSNEPCDATRNLPTWP